jgi:NADH-quinone oxidoreductase subunit L
MVALVVSDNLIQLFFGWEGVGLASYLLIGFWHHKKSANLAAMKAFLVNRVADFGFLIGIATLYICLDTLSINDVIAQKDKLYQIQITFLGQQINALVFACFFLFIGAMGKSAQFGFHTWLPDAMEGPTPVSALIHAATMVTAGVFLTVRFSELMVMSDFVMTFVLTIGLMTAFFAASVGFFQKDIKKVIAYSTCSQLGFMFVACGLGAFNVAIFHLITHGYFKALLFLSSGSVIHGVHDEQDMDKMGNLFSQMKFTAIMMWIGTLAIIGFPYSSGYFSKDLILSSSFNLNQNGALVYVILAVVSAMTAFYSFRLIFKVFHGKYRGEYKYEKIHESGFFMLTPLFILSIGAIFAGYFLKDIIAGNNLNDFWRGVIFIGSSEHHYSSMFTILSKSLVGLGVLIAVYYYGFQEVKLLQLKNQFRSIYLFVLNKWYFDELYDKIFVKPTYNLGKFLWKNIDQGLVDRFIPNGGAAIVDKISKKIKRIQSGFIFDYTFIIIMGFTLFITIIFYTSIA